MPFTRRRIRSTLRAVLPLLALVWASLPLHDCNLASAAADGGTAWTTVAAATDAATTAPTRSDAATALHCGHQSADATEPARAQISCSDLGPAGPDLRPALGLDAALEHRRFDPGWLEQALHSVAPSAGLRPLDDGRWRQRPLHLRKSVLLI